MTRRFVLAGLAILGLGLGGTGCITPSIPIPPPEPAAMTFAVVPTDGTARFSYAPAERFANAIVYVFNDDQGVGIITTATPTGGVPPTEPFPAAIGDQVIITFELGDEAASTCVRVREGTPTGADVCF